MKGELVRDNSLSFDEDSLVFDRTASGSGWLLGVTRNWGGWKPQLETMAVNDESLNEGSVFSIRLESWNGLRGHLGEDDEFITQ